MNKKIVWISNHKLSEKQTESLRIFLITEGFINETDNIEIEKMNHSWYVSDWTEKDLDANTWFLEDIAHKYGNNGIVYISGVFPTVAFEAKSSLMPYGINSNYNIVFVSPVKDKKSGNLRWCKM